MKRSRFSEHQIIAILKAVEAGVDDEDFCCKHETSEATYFQWKSQYGGMQASDIKRLLELEVNMQKAATDKLENMLFRRTGAQ